MKRLISFLLALVMLGALAVPAAAAEPESGETPGSVVTGEQGTEGAYEVLSVVPSAACDGFEVTYRAETDTELLVVAVDEDSGTAVFSGVLFVSAGEGGVFLEADLSMMPKYYRVDAALAAGGGVCSYMDHTREYQKFLSASPDDAAFAGQVVVNYGIGYDGKENFAVIREDVKIVYVDSMDDVEVVGGPEEEDSAELFSFTSVAGDETYTFSGEEKQEVLDLVEAGDRLLILPRDNMEDARAFFVESVEENANLFGEDGQSTVTVTPAADEGDIEDFFEFVRIHVEVEADTEDIDVSTADPDIEVELIEEESEETANLFATLGPKTGTKKLYVKQFAAYNRNGVKVNIKDTVTVSVTVKLQVDFSGLKLKRVVATASVTAQNEFTFTANAKVTFSGSKNIGSIPIGNVYGVNFTIPVDITYYAEFQGDFSFVATQKATISVTARYENGKLSYTNSKSASCGKSISFSGKVTARLGIRPTIKAEVNLLIKKVSANLGCEVGLQVVGQVSSKKKLTVTLSVYIQPSFHVAVGSKKYCQSNWGRATKQIASFSKAAYFTMEELAALTDEQILEQMETYKEQGMAVTIASAADMQAFAEYVNAGRPTAGIDFELNLAEETLDMSAVSWVPIGTEANPFRGTFDGKRARLTGLTVTGSKSNVGLFGYVENAVLHDVTLENVSIEGSNYVGGIVGQAREGSRIYDVTVTGTVAGNSVVGGLVGRLHKSSLLNSANAAAVNGKAAVGGVVGALYYNSVLGQVANCYSVGVVTAENMYGGVCGSVSETELGEGTADEDARYTVTGVTYCYYLAAEGSGAVGGELPAGASVKAWAITEAQGKGEGAAMIAEDDAIAAENNLIDALNNWYCLYGADAESGATTGGALSSSANDAYELWFQNPGEERYPYFGGKGTTYPLTVYYVYEDGREAFPSTTLYLALGESFDVDAYVLPGYYTNVDSDGYRGYMKPDPTTPEWTEADSADEEFSGIEFRVIYMKETVYAGDGASLSAEDPAVSGSIYKIENAADLMGLAAYVAAGGNTEGVVFEQLDNIELTAAVSIGSSAVPFKGTYSGMGISGLTMPLFGGIDGAEVTGLKLSADVREGSGSVGALAGYAENSRIAECSVSVNVNVDADVTGALVGTANNCCIDNCTVTGSVRSAGKAGGISGDADGSVVMNCWVSAAVEGSVGVGGLVGNGVETAVVNCYVSGNVSGSSAVGGLVGAVSAGEVSNGYYSGTVAGSAMVGAAAGVVADGANIESLYYLNGAAAVGIGEGEADGVAVFTADDMESLRDHLNLWVSETTSSKYLTWTFETVADLEGEGESRVGLPVFGANYENWLVDFWIRNGKVSYTFDRDLLGSGTVYLAVYAQNGQMLDIHELSASGEGEFTVSEEAAYAKCFAMDAEAVAMCASVRTAR